MEGMGVKFTPGMGGRLLRHSSVFGPMAGTSGTHGYSKWSLRMVIFSKNIYSYTFSLIITI